jgi:hypothetical protein
MNRRARLQSPSKIMRTILLVIMLMITIAGTKKVIDMAMNNQLSFLGIKQQYQKDAWDWLSDPSNPASPLSPINPSNPASLLNPSNPASLLRTR